MIRFALLALALALAIPAAAAPAKVPAAKRSSARAKVLPFISDDYARALAEARARRVPLFVEAWAPW